MQIHELTSKHLQEGLASALAGGVAKQVGQQLLQKQGINPDRFAGQRVGIGQRPEAAMQANAPLLQQMAKKGQQAWTLAQQELIKRSTPPVASAAYLTPQELKPHLEQLIQQLVGFDYNKSAELGASPEVTMGMKTAKDYINQGIDTILALTKEKPNKAMADKAWLDLTTKGIGAMQTYANQSQASTKPAPNPESAQLLQTIDQKTMDTIAKYVQNKTLNKTGVPAIDGLLTAAGAILR